MSKILVIDDGASIRNVVGVLLRQAGHDVIDAEYGLSGIAMAQTESPDLILLDLMMPVLDGFGVLRRLREDPIARRIPVIMLTAKIDAASERICMDLGAVDYIKKPWGPQEIEERAAMALGYPELVKRQAAARNEPTAEKEKGASPRREIILEQPHDISYEEPHDQTYEETYNQPYERSAERFKTKAFRASAFEVDNPHLA